MKQLESGFLPKNGIHISVRKYDISRELLEIAYCI